MIQVVKLIWYWNRCDETQPLFQTRVSDNHEWVGTLNKYYFCLSFEILTQLNQNLNIFTGFSHQAILSTPLPL